MKFHFIPYVGTDIIEFGATSEQISKVLHSISEMETPEWVHIKSSDFRYNIYECGCQTQFNEQGNCIKIFLSEPAQFYVEGKQILGKSLDEVREILLQLDPNLDIIGDSGNSFFISYKYGIRTEEDSGIINSITLEKVQHIAFILIPHVGTDIIQFGMTSQQISKSLGLIPESIRQEDNFLIDYYEFCQVFFDENENCNEIQVCRPAQIYWKGIPLLGELGNKITDLFFAEDPNLQILDRDDGCFTSKKYDVSVSGIEGKIETVAFGKQGIYKGCP